MFPAEVSDILHPLLLKFALRGVEALGHKAGQPILFYKGRGKQSAYQAILLLCSWAKAQDASSELQLSSKPGGSVVFGAQLVRAVHRWCMSRGLTCFTLFADITAAYYSTVRQLVAAPPGACSDDASERALDGLKLSPDDLERLRAHMNEPTAARCAGADPWTEAVACEVTAGTFFLVRGDPVPVAYRGTRPGSSWADVLFAVVIRRVLECRNRLRGELECCTRAPRVPWDGNRTREPCSSDDTIAIEDVVWADDMASMRICDDNRQVARCMGLEVGCTADVPELCVCRLSPHTAPGVQASPSGKLKG